MSIRGAITRSARAVREFGWTTRKAIFRPSHHFIHIPKNGGVSIRMALGSRVSLTRPYHYRYRDIAEQIDGLRCFCVVRNPWSRTVSRYLFSKQAASRWSESDPLRVYILSATFEQYVRDHVRFDIPEHPPGMSWMGPMTSWYDQLEWITDADGRVIGDCLRLEHLSEDLTAYFGRRIEIGRRNSTRDRRDYRSMYTDDLAEVVADIFSADIEHFGFKFDGPAVRNIANC